MLNNVLAPNQLYGMAQQAIINGNFDSWQRGTSFINPSNVQYLEDHWRAQIGTGTPTTLTHSKQTLTAGDIPNAYYYHRLTTDGAGTTPSDFRISQPIENGNRYLCGLNKKITVSFWARSSIGSKKLGVFFIQSYGTGGSPSAAEFITGNNFTLTSTWTKYSFTCTTNTLVSKTFGTNNDDVLTLNLQYAWDASVQSRVGASVAETFVGAGNIDIAQVNVSSGDVIPGFQPFDPSEVLGKCQRFVTAYTDANTSFPIGNGFALSTTQARIQVELPTAMRIAPTLTATATDWQISDGVTATDLTSISIVSGQSSDKTVTLLCTVASGLTQFRPYQLIADGTANRLMIFDAEL